MKYITLLRRLVSKSEPVSVQPAERVSPARSLPVYRGETVLSNGIGR